MSRLFGLGNKKLDPCIATFNMTTSHNCPSRKLGLCSHDPYCYARSPECFRPNVLLYRMRQGGYWRHCVNEAGLDAFIGKWYQDTVGKRVSYFRFSVSGDFPGQRDVDFMARFCKVLKQAGIKSYGYTARRDLDFSDLRKIAVLNGQNHLQSNKYIVHRDSIPKSANYVCPGKCGPDTCMICAEKRGINIHTILRR
jgi:hypothetical protein